MMEGFVAIVVLLFFGFVMSLVGDVFQEGWSGVIFYCGGYLLLIGLFGWIVIRMVCRGASKTSQEKMLLIFIALCGFIFLWQLLELLVDVSQGRKQLTTEHYKFYPYSSRGHIGHYRLELPEINFYGDINESTYRRLRIYCGEPITVEYYPHSEMVFSVKVNTRSTAVMPAK